MAKLVKLDISGIRGFAPCSDEEHTHQINFSSPLTLILGQNGCGKTTIVEAINFVCSGEVLGSKKDFLDFITDPKLSKGEDLTTKAKIKLQMIDGEGNRITMDKTMEVDLNSVCKFKGKHPIMTVVSPDGKISTSTDAHVGKKFRQMIRMSPAVLNNVVFCHQENSTWPFSEGPRLKEKFDEIFELEKYKRCVQAFQKVYEEKEGRIKELKQQLFDARDKKEVLEQRKRMLQEKEDKLKSLEQEVERISDQLELVKRRFEEVHELKSTLDSCRGQLTMKEINRERVVEEQKTIRKGIPPENEFEGGDEELKNEMITLEAERQRDEYTIKELEKKKIDAESEGKVVAAEIEEVQMQLGKLTEKKIQYSNKCVERKKLLEQIKDEMDLKVGSNWDRHEEAKSALEELKKALESWRNDLDVWIEATKAEEARLQEDVDKVKESKVHIKGGIELKKKQVEELQQKMSELSLDLVGLAISEEQLKDYALQIEKIDEMIANLNTNFDESEESKELENQNRNIEKMEVDLQSLEKELKILQQNEVSLGRIEEEKSLMEEKLSEFKKIIEKHSDDLNQLFAGAIPERNVTDALLFLQSEAESKAKNLTEKIDSKQQKIVAWETNLFHQMDKIRSCEEEVEAKQQKISQLCDGRRLDEALEMSFQKKERLQREQAQYESMKILFKKYIKVFEKESTCCPICETDFRHRSDMVRKIVARLRKKLEEIPAKLAWVRDELKKEEQLYDQLQPLKVEVDQLSSATLPRLKVQLKNIQQSLDEDKMDLDCLKCQLDIPRKIVDMAKRVIPDMASLDQIRADLERARMKVEILKETLVQGGTTKSKEELNEEVGSLKDRINQVRTLADTQTRKIDEHRDKQQLLNSERKGLVDEEMRLRASVRSRSTLEAQRNELVKKVEDLEREISKLTSSLNLTETLLQDAIQNKEDFVLVNDQQVQEERQRIDAHSNIIQDIERLQKEIEDYIDVDDTLSEVEEKMKHCKLKQDVLTQSKEEAIRLISQKKEELDGQVLRFRILEDNVILRNKMALEATLESEIESLKEKLGNYDSKTIEEEERQLRDQLKDVEKQLSTLLGERAVLMTTIKELHEELNTPENKRVLSSYLNKYYQVKLTEHLVYDLYKYIDALERAILDFHQEKMAEINANLHHLWRNIYRGNDIDYIEIKSTLSTAKKKGIIYQIVQVKDGVEQDMRRRCSAGQKLLASLIIRLALADALCPNCGILTLDEPTANLDKETIHNLCQTLSRLIQVRGREKNFQMLLITHDEDFLNELSKFHGTSHFYRVTRDKDGASLIKEETVL